MFGASESLALYGKSAFSHKIACWRVKVWCAVTPSSKKKKGCCQKVSSSSSSSCWVLLVVGGVNQKCVARLSVRCGGQPPLPLQCVWKGEYTEGEKSEITCRVSAISQNDINSVCVNQPQCAYFSYRNHPPPTIRNLFNNIVSVPTILRSATPKVNDELWCNVFSVASETARRMPHIRLGRPESPPWRI